MVKSTQFVSINQTKIAYQVLGEAGDQYPLVMVMGLSGVKEDWLELSQSLARHRQLVVIDNRGIGESDIAEGPYSINMMADDVRAVVDKLAWDKFDLIGVSMGGMISQQFVLNYPRRINKLILMSTAHGGPGQTAVSAEALRAFQTDANMSAFDKVKQFSQINYTPEWIAANPQQFNENIHETLKYKRSGRGVLNQMGAIMGFDLENEIHQISVDTLVIHGTGDRLLDFRNGQLIEEKIPNARLMPIKDAGHLVWKVDRGESARAIERFLVN